MFSETRNSPHAGRVHLAKEEKGKFERKVGQLTVEVDRLE